MVYHVASVFVRNILRISYPSIETFQAFTLRVCTHSDSEETSCAAGSTAVICVVSLLADNVLRTPFQNIQPCQEHSTGVCKSTDNYRHVCLSRAAAVHCVVSLCADNVRRAPFPVTACLFSPTGFHDNLSCVLCTFCRGFAILAAVR